MPSATFESLQADIKARKFAPIYFLCGEQEYFTDTICNLLENQVLSDMEKAFNQTILYGKDSSARQIMEAARRLPMMAERQVVIVKEAQALSLKEEEEQQYLNYLKNPSKTTVLVFAWKHGKPDGRKSFSREIQKAAVYFESKKLYDNQVAPIIKNWLNERKFKMEDRAVDLLVEFTGIDLSKVMNELEKLIIGKPTAYTITLEDIEKGVGLSKDFNVFELGNVLGAKNRYKTQQIVTYFLANPKNGPLVLVVGYLLGYFNKLYLGHQLKGLQDKDFAQMLGVSPFFAKDYRGGIQNYSVAQIEKVIHLLEHYDLRSKGVNNGDTEEGELLRELVFRILNV
ncbi:MAG: DNA polymerase III subunit delta [Bacteroidetes bacterium]|nr:DNA polymerase III subunit delta [Bacteroidota bacterium]MBK8658216.1 DNA polymerase III subunit delta [Bacteroidota bacterium]